MRVCLVVKGIGELLLQQHCTILKINRHKGQNMNLKLFIRLNHSVGESH